MIGTISYRTYPGLPKRCLLEVNLHSLIGQTKKPNNP